MTDTQLGGSGKAGPKCSARSHHRRLQASSNGSSCGGQGQQQRVRAHVGRQRRDRVRQRGA
ncbi:hypothetical protein LP419_25035 [Massilia sp. H-1]|nr:hypothetical protein LP419_25035 [Massilia sp. H-1]